ncbi:hypothetical protein P885DRAFT_75862 [Corynascus similis CBS 632.67]
MAPTFGSVQGRNVVAGPTISGGTNSLNFHEDSVPGTSRERSLERLDSLPEAFFDAANKQHAGTGKSTIALTVAREYSDKKRLGASFFFSRGGGDLASTRRFATTIAAQLAEVSPQLRGHIADAAFVTHRVYRLGLYDQWERFTLQPLAQLSKEVFPYPLVIVVDALDECDNDDDVSHLIRCLASASTVKQVNLRIYVTSMPDLPVNIGFGDISTHTHQDFILHDIEQSIVDQDLAIYYKHQLGRIAQTSCLDATFLSDDSIQTLVQRSCGLFIYAATVCRFVRDGGPLAGERLAYLMSTERLPARAGATLDQMYLTVLEYTLTTELDPEEMARLQELFQRVIGTVVVLFDSLSPTNLALMLDLSKETIAVPLSRLHSLLDIPEEDKLLQFLHPSFREFLLDAQRYHPHDVFAVAISPDSRLIVSGSEAVRTWDVATGAERRMLQGHTAWVSAVAVSSDGRLIVSGSQDKTVRIWDATTGAEHRVLRGHTAPVSAVAVSPGGRCIVSASWDKTVRIWDAATGAERRVLRGHSGPVHAVTISPDSCLIVSGLI